MILTRRLYDPPAANEGSRFLVDRLWPRGVGKEQLHLDAWLEEAAPGDGLRRWFGHRPERWEEFKQRYTAELEERPQAWQPLLEAARKRDVVLLYGAMDREHNNAIALKESLEQRIAAPPFSQAIPAASIYCRISEIPLIWGPVPP